MKNHICENIAEDCKMFDYDNNDKTWGLKVKLYHFSQDIDGNEELITKDSIFYNDIGDKILIKEDAYVTIEITYCPFCGKKL